MADDLDFDNIRLDEFIPISRHVITAEIYEKNIAALNKHHAELTELIEQAVIDESRIKIETSESGSPRILYIKDDGEELYIHSADDPAACANQAIDLMGKIGKNGMVVLFGFGLGYFAEAVLKVLGKGHILLVYEAVPELFKTALRTRDISGLLESEKVKIILGENADNFSVLHSHHHLIQNGQFWIIKHHPSVKINIAAYDNFHKRLDEEKALSDIGIRTMTSRGKEFMNAFFENVPDFIANAGVNKLKDIFKDRPAIVVSAGPSLDKNLHLLKKAKGKAVIITVDGALPTLLPCGIIPDLVVAIDPELANINDKFLDNPLLKDVPFICLAQYTPTAIKIYPGPLFLNNVPQNIACQWLGSYWEDKGCVETFGGSVAHFAFAVAEFVGASGIAFVGQDLSYKGGRVHTYGYSDSLDRQSEDAIKRGAPSIPMAQPAENIFKEQVYTIPQFLVFKTSFENRIKVFKGIVVNATEEGLAIDGAPSLRLADYIDDYCAKMPEMDTLSILLGIQHDKTSCNLEGLIAEVKAVSDKYSGIKKASQTILKYIKRINSLKKGRGYKDSPELSDVLNKVELLIEEVKSPMLNLLVGYHYGLELYLKKQIIQDIDEIEDKWEKLTGQLERGQNYYSELIKAIDLFNAQLKKLLQALEIEKKVLAILADEALGVAERYYRTGKLYIKADMPARAVKYLELSVEGLKAEGKLPGVELLISLAEMYIKQFRFYEAQELLARGKGQEARGRGQRQGEKIEQILITCDKKIKAWEQRKKEMSKILEVAEKNYGGHLESGWFYSRVKDYERAEKAYIKAIEEGQGAPTEGADARGKGQENSELPNSRRLSGTPNSELVSAYYGLAHTYLAQEKAEDAVATLEKAIEVDPQNPLLYRDLGFIAFQSNNMEAAEMFFIKALELAPQDIELYKTLVNLYVGIGDIEKATALYEDALLANPNNPAIQKDLAMLYKEIITKTGRA